MRQAPQQHGRADGQRHSNPQSRSQQHQRSRRWRIVFGTAAALFLTAAIAVFFGSLFLLQVQQSLPEVDHLADIQSQQPSIVLSADGQQLTMFKNMQREWIGVQQVSPWVVRALLAIEDRQFYSHEGVDFRRTAAAAWNSLNGTTQGGSTITQQLARNLFPEEIGRSRSAHRKIREMLMAMKIERNYSKDEILEIYLNTVPFLYNVFGIEMAARTYYAKTAAELDALESATLVGMLKGTHYYNPVVNPARSLNRRNLVLTQLARSGALDEREHQRLQALPLQLRFNRQPEPVYGPALHFTEHVRRWLTNWAQANDVDLYADGLIIHTTLDTGLQEMALQSVDKQTRLLQAIADVEWAQRSAQVLSHSPAAYEKKRTKLEPFSYFWKLREDLLHEFIKESPQYRKAVEAGKPSAAALKELLDDDVFMAQLQQGKTRLEAGFVAMSPSSGEVRAWVGSRDFGRDQFDHVAQALRQPGSTFKPIVYGAALERGFSPTRTYLDTRMNIGSAEGGNWTPTDMAAATEVPMSMRDGLVLSRNTITAQVMRDVGLSDIVELARASGINRSRLDVVPSLALGTSPVSLLEMVTAYSTIARLGQYREPVVVRRITDRNGKVLAEFGSAPTPAMSETSAIELIDMMRGVLSRGTGQDLRSRFGIQADVAGKTGTTQYNTDGWFILMHPDLVTGSWVGFNDARITMRSNYWGQGGHNALLLVGDFYKSLLKHKRIDAKLRFPKPAGTQLMAASGSSSRWLERGASSSGTEAEFIIQSAAESAAPSAVSAGIEAAAGAIVAGDPLSAARAAARGAIDIDSATSSTSADR